MATSTGNMIKQLNIDVTKAQNNLLHAKVQQVQHTSASQGPEPTYKMGDLMTLGA